MSSSAPQEGAASPQEAAARSRWTRGRSQPSVPSGPDAMPLPDGNRYGPAHGSGRGPRTAVRRVGCAGRRARPCLVSRLVDRRPYGRRKPGIRLRHLRPVDGSRSTRTRQITPTSTGPTVDASPVRPRVPRSPRGLDPRCVASPLGTERSVPPRCGDPRSCHQKVISQLGHGALIERPYTHGEPGARRRGRALALGTGGGPAETNAARVKSGERQSGLAHRWCPVVPAYAACR